MANVKFLTKPKQAKRHRRKKTATGKKGGAANLWQAKVRIPTKGRMCYYCGHAPLTGVPVGGRCPKCLCFSWEDVTFPYGALFFDQSTPRA